ncbi:hypothetical protein [Roseitranquillus sediminis]|uniref:hypothetical protein n=1 Tax=Roseitranquillus sediminis TaxID=2809051 RepID=UPI001D0CB0F5|nr:hypothetical protein [Roseitranquillus sediminis]MBM9595498.1 hypothetical protein [Roseitranquillus sediminis]
MQISGVLVSLEVKTQTGRQSPDQKAWEERCREIGAAYHVVRSIEEAYQEIDKKARNFAALWRWHFMPKKRTD